MENKKYNISGKDYLVLEKDALYIVQNGKVELFNAPFREDEFTGFWQNCGTFNKGEMFSGLVSHQAHIFIATGIPGTEIEKLSVDDIDQQRLEAIIEKNTQRLLSKIQRSDQYAESVRIIDNENKNISEKGLYSVNDGILWIKKISGKADLGFECLNQAFDEEALIPITSNILINVEEKTELAILKTSQINDKKEMIKYLDLLISDLFIENRIVLDRKESERIDISFEKQQDLFDSSLRELFDIFETDSEKKFMGEHEDDIIFSLQTIARYLDTNTQIKDVNGDKNRRLMELLNAYELSTRKVLLTGEWETGDNGPLILVRKEDKAIMPAIPETPSTYRVFLNSKESFILDREKAVEFAKYAISVYRPLPPDSLKVKDLIDFVMKSVWKKDRRNVIYFSIIVGVLGTIIPITTGKLIDTVIPESDMTGLFTYAMLLFLTTVSIFVFNISKTISMIRVESQTDGSLQAAVWSRVLNLSPGFFKKYSSGDLATRTMGINQIRQIISGSVMSSVFSGIFSIFYLLLMFHYNKKLAFLGLGIATAGMIFNLICSYFQVKKESILVGINGKLNGIIFGVLSGIAKFKSSGSEKKAFALWSSEYSKKKKVAIEAGSIRNLIEIFNAVFPVICSIAIFAFYYTKGARDPISGHLKLSTGQFLAFNAAFTSMLVALISLSDGISNGLRVIPIFKRAIPILEENPEIGENRKHPGDLRGNIEVSHLSFKYTEDGPLILDDVSFSIEEGQFVALVGPSGSGKSTLFRLLLGFETPDNGGIYYDSQDLSEIDVRAVRRQLGVVLQNGKLLAGDIFTNIIGSRNLTIDQAWDAAKAAGLDEDLKKMPMGMHTVVSESGGTLSGGQRQRLLIARSIVHKPRILYFDEATSALDNRTQKIVSDSIESLKSTRIVIAHRLSTIKNADKIIVLEKGIVKQVGTFDELVDVEGPFKELAKRQML